MGILMIYANKIEKKIKISPFHIFHSIEFLIVLFIVSFYSKLFAFVFAGIGFPQTLLLWV